MIMLCVGLQTLWVVELKRALPQEAGITPFSGEHYSVSSGQAASLPWHTPPHPLAWRDLRSRGGERRATLGSPCKEGLDTPFIWVRLFQSGAACQQAEAEAVHLANEMQAEYWSVSAKTGE